MTPTDTIKLSPEVISPVNLNARIDSLNSIKLRTFTDLSAPKTDSGASSIKVVPSTTIINAEPPKVFNSAIQKTDSIAGSDSIPASEAVFGVVLKAPEPPIIKENPPSQDGMSFIIGGLLLLFCIIGLRFHNNRKYITALFHNLVEVRVRSNVFDETVRETSFIVLLNLLWSCSAGMVLMALLIYTLPDDPSSSFGILALYSKPALSTAVCMGLMTFYSCTMAVIYLTVGTVFSDLVHARLWVKGFSASQGLLSVVFFPLALLLLFYPQWSVTLLYIALSTFLLAKLIFIWKGFRIFFTQFSSWVLFLYYLCSLEIVPLILTYWAACQLCSLL